MVDHAVPFDEADAAADPYQQFGRWYAEARPLLAMPDAVVLATASLVGQPSARMVLLKHWDEHGFVIYTNYRSRKGRELQENPQAALLFSWEPLGRQVRVEGPVTPTSAQESDDYFATRPRAAQVGAHASRQSEPTDRRDALDRRVQELAATFGDGPVPRPPWWGGFRLAPTSFEFWQNRRDRLHDRLAYTPSPTGSGWDRVRLQP